MGFFGIIALLLAALSLAFFVPVFFEFLETGAVDKFPTLFVCGFVMLAAIMSLFAGLILSNIGIQNKRDFEYRFTSVSRIEREDSKEDK